MNEPSRSPQAIAATEWSRHLNTARNLWVIAVLAFWVTLGILLLVFFLRDEVNLILVSIALGLMILGVWLKARYQWIVRKEAERTINGKDH